MRDRESVSNELDRQGDSSYSTHSGELYIGRCIKYLADTLYLIHLENTTDKILSNETNVDLFVDGEQL